MLATIAQSPRTLFSNLYWPRASYCPVATAFVLIFEIAYLKFACACILLKFVIQYLELYRSTVFRLWNSNLAEHFSNAVYDLYVTGQPICRADVQVVERDHAARMPETGQKLLAKVAIRRAGRRLRIRS